MYKFKCNYEHEIIHIDGESVNLFEGIRCHFLHSGIFKQVVKDLILLKNVQQVLTLLVHILNSLFLNPLL